MTAKDDKAGYKLKLTGTGITVDLTVPEATAQQIVALIMGRAPDMPHAPNDQSTAMLDAGSEGRGVTPKTFMTLKRPQTDVERITCLAFYLTHMRNTAQFKTKELTEVNIEAAQPRLSNSSFTARNAVSLNYLSLAGGGRKQITDKGETLVRALPDRGKAKVALESFPKRRRSRKRHTRTS